MRSCPKRAASDGATPRWFASFARLGAAALEVERSGRLVWSAERVRSFDPKEPYYVGDAPLDSP